MTADARARKIAHAAELTAQALELLDPLAREEIATSWRRNPAERDATRDLVYALTDLERAAKALRARWRAWRVAAVSGCTLQR